MQVSNKHNWPDRSLSYVCRSFDQLYRGNEYEEALSVIHIGFLDFTLFPDYPEFYSSHMLLNVKNHHLFSSKIKLSVIDLSKIELATEEDKVYRIDYWARLFKAKTWEELKMLANENEYLNEAADSIYKANTEEIVRQQCLAREDAERRERTLERDKAILKEEIATLKDDNAALKDNNAALMARIAELEQALAETNQK
jgi:type I restriction-modification system DNA methylase subunit